MKNDVNRYVYTPKAYKIDQHPLIAGRRATLSPMTKCIFIERRAQIEAMAIGHAFEEKLAGLIRSALPNAKIYTDVYFESGIYHPEMMMYESVQICNFCFIYFIDCINHQLTISFGWWFFRLH